MAGVAQPWRGGALTARASAILAGNASAMTLDGTNSWLLLEPGSARAVVVDPGPADPAHLGALTAAAEGRGARIALILLTHRHPDHAEGAPALRALTGARIRAMPMPPGSGGGSPGGPLGGYRAAGPGPGEEGPLDPDVLDGGLVEGEVLDIDGLELRVLATPGHTGDSMCLLMPADHSLLTGDTVLGRGTTVIAHPDGHLGQYMASLDRLSDVVAQAGVTRILPGHGPARAHPADLIAGYRSHRLERLRMVREALASGATGEALLDAAYPGVPRSLRHAAGASLAAAVAHLTERQNLAGGV
jgi:glyoxylase-like metal-dependent hydrolase (beta-lactamase superfamily II)